MGLITRSRPEVLGLDSDVRSVYQVKSKEGKRARN